MATLMAPLAAEALRDERLDVYSRQMGDMFAVFEKSKGARGALQEEYDRRNQEVLDKLAAVREWTEQQAKQQLDRTRAFSTEFSDGVTRGARDWRAHLTKEHGEVTGVCEPLSEEMAALDAAIQQEHEDCVAHMDEENASILEQLRELREALTQQAGDREREHAEFSADIDQHFGRLRHRLHEEADVRKKQCTATLSQARVRYTRLEERVQRHGSSMEASLEDLRRQLANEQAERVAAQEKISKNLAGFMVELEKNIAATRMKQQVMATHLLGMKAKVREEAA